jgi:23S rRNA (adenine2030-N6)-methyltransferase
VPPVERGGLVVIDPPFEDDGDFGRLTRALAAAHRKWPGGTYLLWYPIKGRPEPDALARRLRRSTIPKILRAELCVAATAEEGPLGGCGLIVVNPPWRLETELSVMLPALAAALTAGAESYRLDWLTAER